MNQLLIFNALELDSSDTGGVTASRFLQFESAFGPLQRSLHNVKTLLTKPYVAAYSSAPPPQKLSVHHLPPPSFICRWFHGFLTRAEGHRLLEGEKPGTFLVRFSGSSPGCFALSTVNSGEGIENILIEADPPYGVCARVGEGGTKLHFASVCELVEVSICNICKYPFVCEFLKERYDLYTHSLSSSPSSVSYSPFPTSPPS